MAKKEKVQLTPEEIADRKIRRSNGWTRFWAIFLSFAIVAGVFAFARSQGLGVDSNSDLNSVVGGFLGRGDKKETCPKGMTLDTIDVKKDDGTTEKLYHGSNYTLKATTLQPNDIQNLSVNGDTYEFTLADSSNPDRSGNTALSRFTNDIVVLDEVNTEIKNFVSVVTVTGLNANYKNIKVKAVITDGKLQSLEYSFTANAELQLKAGLSITGTGNLAANAKYSNFVY